MLRESSLERAREIFYLDLRGCIFVNDFLPLALYNLLRLKKARAKAHGYKYVQCRAGVIYVRKDDGQTPLTIATEADLRGLILLPPGPSSFRSSAPPLTFLKIAQFNANSLRGYLAFIRATLLDRSFHIIFISETWLHSFISDDSINFNNYFLIRNDREGREGEGVACYIHNSFLKQRCRQPLPICTLTLRSICSSVCR